MTEKQFQRLQAEWDARLRATGFQDIEAPSGIIERRETKAPTEAKLRRLAQLEQDREATPRLRFGEAWERRAWELHLEGLSNRAVAEKCCVYRKLVDETFDRLRWQGQRKRPGPAPDPEAMRHDGVNLTVRLTRDAALAADHLRASGIEPSEVVRAHIIEVARKTQGRTAA